MNANYQHKALTMSFPSHWGNQCRIRHVFVVSLLVGSEIERLSRSHVSTCTHTRIHTYLHTNIQTCKHTYIIPNLYGHERVTQWQRLEGRSFHSFAAMFLKFLSPKRTEFDFVMYIISSLKCYLSYGCYWYLAYKANLKLLTVKLVKINHFIKILMCKPNSANAPKLQPFWSGSMNI